MAILWIHIFRNEILLFPLDCVNGFTMPMTKYNLVGECVSCQIPKMYFLISHIFVCKVSVALCVKENS